MSNQAYLNNIKQGAIQGWHTHKILPSLTGAQAALESGWGSSKLSKPPYNNNFGIKAGDDWTGRTVTMSTQEWVGGRYITINDSFRAYDSLSDSVKDHAAFFTNTPWRTQNYRNVVGERDYKRVAQAVSSAGYATDPSYVSKIIRIIEENNLYNWDQEAFNGNVANSGPTQENTNKEKTVGKDISTAAKTTTEDYTITVIGDSLGVGTEPFLKQLKWSKANYDNYGSRQWTHSTKIYSAIDILTDLASAGSLNNNVIFILGTNRGVDASEIDTAVGIIGRDRNIILVDTASEVNHRNTVSNRYKEASKRHENVFYANWSDKARPNIASWYYADGAGGTRIHMNSTGYKKHADFIVQAIYEANATSWEKEINTPTQKSEENIDIYNIEYDDGKYTSPKGDSSIYNAELNQQYGFKPRKGEIMWIERIYEGNEDNPSDLLEGALRFMEEHSVPGAQYTVNMRYLPEDIAIGDTGIFVDHEFNPPLYIEARVLEINTSVSNPESDSVVLGNVIEVHPKDKSDILSIQKELQKTREDLQTEFWKEKPVNLEMLTSNGLHLSTDNYIPKNELNKYKYDHVKVENGTGIVHLTAPRDPENDFTFYGHIADNYIDAVDELVDEIINVDGEEIIFDEPIDPNTNPQGPDVLDPNDLGEIRELKVKEFDVEFLDILGRKIGEDTIQVYEDSTFSYKVSGYTKSINKINILSTSSFTLDVVSFKEDDDYKSPFADKTRLYVKAIQEAEDVTYKFKNFIWTRVSDNQRSDEEWNDINKWNETSGINLTASDIEGNESTFICRMYDDDFNFVNAIGATVKIALEGKSAYEQAVENGYEGTEEEWIDSLRGSDGENGIPGEPGEDGQSTYIHVAWAHSPMGDGFSTSDSTDKLYMGTYVDEIEADSENYSDYKWTRVKGDKGETGETGPRGLTGLQGPEGKQGIEGKKGTDGKSSYTHIAYATGDQGQTFNHETFPQATHIGMYVSDNQNSSDNWKDYKWTLIKGANGARGLEGPKGKDGRTPYFHTAWANSANGKSGFSTTVSAGKLYLGTATTFDPDDPTDYTKYNWTLIKGEKGDTGPRGLTGLQGPEGKQGIEGKKGTDGKSSYTHIAYATGDQGQTFNHETFPQATHIGMYVSDNQNSSDNWKDYKWTLIKGANGARGLEGPKGKDGRTPYFHTAWANSANGKSGFSTTVSAGKLYLGTATTFDPDDPTDYTKYNWTLIKGEKGDTGPQGPRGLQGPNGANGQSQWVHVRYSVNSNGSGMTPSPSSTTKYVGIAVTNSATAPAFPEFTWSKYVGENGSNGAQGPQGVPGKNGANGTTTYTWVRYADTPTSGMNNFPEGKKYIGLAFNKTTPTESSNYSDYKWSLMPQNIEIGGRNLLMNSGEKVSNGEYNIARYDLTDKIKEGEEVTLTIWGSLAKTKSNFVAYNSGDMINLTTLADNGNGTYSRTFKWKIGSSTNTYLSIYAFTNAQTGTSTINKIKLERGNIATDWTEAPEDVQGQIDEKAAQIDFDTVLSEQAVALDKIEALNTEINATKDNLIISHSAEYIEKIEKVLGSSENADARLKVLDEQRVQIETYFQFDDAFTIGRSNSKNKVRITNEQMQFLDGETILAYASGNYFFIKNMKVEQALEVGVHKIEEENGITVGRFIGG